VMEVRQPPGDVGEAEALVAATSPAVPSARTPATPARTAYQAGPCVNRIPMITPLASSWAGHQSRGMQSGFHQPSSALPGHGVFAVAKKQQFPADDATPPRSCADAPNRHMAERNDKTGADRGKARAPCRVRRQIRPVSGPRPPAQPALQPPGQDPCGVLAHQQSHSDKRRPSGGPRSSRHRGLRTTGEAKPGNQRRNSDHLAGMELPPAHNALPSDAPASGPGLVVAHRDSGPDPGRGWNEPTALPGDIPGHQPAAPACP
jgi:hypothetical protein